MNALSIVKYVFTVIGIGMLIGTGFMYQHTRAFIASAAAAEGTVVDLRESRSSRSITYRPVIRYTTAAGELVEFVSQTGSSPPSYSRGDKVGILYRPSAPMDASISSFFGLWLWPLIVGGMGSAFFLIGGGIFLATTFKKRRDDSLKTRGTPIQTTLQSVDINTSVSTNGRHPFRVVTQWQDPATSRMHVFESDDVWFDPTSYIQGRSITVFVDLADPEQYSVDLSFLPKLA